jgi:predicted ATPase
VECLRAYRTGEAGGELEAMTRISRIAARNFRSFRDIEVNVGPLEVIIGPNAAGKSNLVEVVRFLSDIAKTGFENAVSLHGGPEFIPNASTPDEETVLSLTVEHDPPNEFWPYTVFGSGSSSAEVADVLSEELTISISGDTRSDYSSLANSQLKVKAVMAKPAYSAQAERSLGTVTVDVPSSGEAAIRLSEWSGSYPINQNELHSAITMPGGFGPSRPAAEQLFADLLPIGRFLREVRAYQFDPRTIERAVPISGPADLESDASNLPIVLKRLLRDEENRSKLLRLLKRLLPFLQELDVVRQADQSLLIEYIEGFAPGKPLPAFLMSGGTRNLTAMIVALYFEDSSLTIIEEPEANIHPMLISRICEMFGEASADRQVMVTTHNPETLRYVPIESVLVVSRDADGFSRVERVCDRPGVAEFLEQELGVSDLQLMGLLGGAR